MTQTQDAKQQPVIVDLGSISRKDLKRLRRGEGSAMDEVRQVTQSVKASGAADAPLVVLYRKKRKKVTSSRKLGLPFPFPFV